MTALYGCLLDHFDSVFLTNNLIDKFCRDFDL